MEYYAIDKNGELRHWKYIKKKKVNGKWRYYYDRDKRNEDLRRKLGYDARSSAAVDVQEYEWSKKNAEAYEKIKTDPTRVKWYDQKKADELNAVVKSKGKQASLSLRRYYNTPLGKIDKLDDKIDSARNFIADLLTKAADSVRAKEEDITKYR